MWCEHLSLSGWKVYVLHEQLGEGSFANCGCDIQSRIATIRMNTLADIPVTSADLKHFSLHEVVHIVTADLWELAASRYVTPDELNRAEHDIVVRMTNLILATTSKSLD